jgi:hypothetical protein
MASIRPTPTVAEREQAANDLLYEVQMLSNAAALLEDDHRWTWGWDDKTLYMATLESFLTHARSLADFVCPPSDYETRQIHSRGVFAADYCTQPWRPQPWPTLREEHKQISVEIQHLTLDRPPVGRNWRYAALRDRLKAMLLSFLDEADLLSSHVKGQLHGVLANDVRVSIANTGMPGIAISSQALADAGGLSRATSSMIDPSSSRSQPRAASHSRVP